LTRAGEAQYPPLLKDKKGELDMKRMIVMLLGASIASTLVAQAQTVAPFKLGTFQSQSGTFVGIVIGDSIVVDFAAASRAITPASNIRLPADMKDLISRYDSACEIASSKSFGV
jgi:hypothetical protein